MTYRDERYSYRRKSNDEYPPNYRLGLWIPAFAGMTTEVVARTSIHSPHRQCSSRVSSQLITRPTINPNTDRITTPASS
ncbi:hypothetical protein Bra471DRAFT_00672 [Bradyrhizobium sp. WSM471]|nr:hypothetical protein Bra471DRAFT_00672 [Bradyrhizobium sp. WSM471]